MGNIKSRGLFSFAIEGKGNLASSDPNFPHFDGENAF